MTGFFIENEVNLLDLGAHAQPGFDNFSILQQAINNYTRIKIPKGNYYISQAVSFSGFQNIIIEADDAEIYGDLQSIFNLSRTKNIVIVGVTFRSTRDGGSVSLSQGLITIANTQSVSNRSAYNITFKNCRFTAPLSGVTGIKVLMEGVDPNTSVMDGLYIHNCQFVDLGRMGIEFQNHRHDIPAIRYRNIVVSNSNFDGTGIASPDPNGNLISGQSVSFSGLGENLLIDSCNFNNYEWAGVEIVGCSNSTVTNCSFSNGRVSSRNDSAPISISEMGRPYLRQKDIILTNNRTETLHTKVTLYNIERISLSGNIWLVSKRFDIRYVIDLNMTGDKIVSNGPFGVLFDHVSEEFPLEDFGCKNIGVYNSLIDCSQSTVLTSVGRTNGGVYDINFYQSTFLRPLNSTSSFFSATNEAVLPSYVNCRLYNGPITKQSSIETNPRSNVPITELVLNTSTVELTNASLNSAYSINRYPVGTRVYCSNIEIMYERVSRTTWAKTITVPNV